MRSRRRKRRKNEALFALAEIAVTFLVMLMVFMVLWFLTDYDAYRVFCLAAVISSLPCLQITSRFEEMKNEYGKVKI